MKIPEKIIKTLPDNIKEPFMYWRNYLEKNISFNLTGSDIHTKEHAERVLLYALLHRKIGSDYQRLAYITNDY